MRIFIDILRIINSKTVVSCHYIQASVQKNSPTAEEAKLKKKRGYILPEWDPMRQVHLKALCYLRLILQRTLQIISEYKRVYRRYTEAIPPYILSVLFYGTIIIIPWLVFRMCIFVC
ncbi:hypothetical protein XENTR_v10021211 [Xenopus tropicalis]|nr:hypothetical protein XENTR_v10021211 [Xenopus tropicalis]